MPFAPAPAAPRVLVVDDHRKIREPLAIYLRRHSFEVRTAEDAAGMWQLLKTQAFDVIVLDVLLPDGDGFELCNQLHRRSNTPVILLTARDAAADRIRGLDLGADDYMAKPFALSELEARVRALTRRGAGGGPTVLRHGRLAFDQVGRVVTVDEQAVELSAREVSLLEILLQRSGRMVSKKQLVDHLCEWGEEVSTNAIEVYVHRLRKKLEPGVKIATVRGLGYCLERDTSTQVSA